MAQVQRAISKGGKQYLTSPLSEFIFDSGGWKEIGWLNSGGSISKKDATISIFIPENINIKSATLNINLASRKLTGGSGAGIPDGYYCPTNIKLYNGLEGDEVYFNYPFASEPAIVTPGGLLNINFGTWNTTGLSTVQFKTIDLTNDIIKGQRYEIKLTGGTDSYVLNGEYTDGGIIKIEFIVLGIVE